MPERRYLAIVPIHGLTRVFEDEDLTGIKQNIDSALERPKRDYPHHDFESNIQLYNVRPLRRRERIAWKRLNGEPRV